MKQASRKHKREPITLYFHQRIREGVFILTFALSLFFLLSLLTYHPSDPGWSSIGVSGNAANAGGFAGAWFSDLFLYVFGYPAFLFPLMLVYSAWMLMRMGRQI